MMFLQNWHIQIHNKFKKRFPKYIHYEMNIFYELFFGRNI